MAGCGRNYEVLTEYFPCRGIEMLDACKGFISHMPNELWKRQKIHALAEEYNY